MGNLNQGNASLPSKHFSTLPFFAIGLSNWERPVHWGINSCQMYNWFWVIWRCSIYPSLSVSKSWGITLSPGWSWGITKADLAYCIIKLRTYCSLFCFYNF
jgi:hypothetical protein